MRIAVLACAAALAGCASPAYHQDRAASASPVQLCEAYFYGPGPVQRAAAYEREYRGLDCNLYRQEAALMFQSRTQRGIAADAALNNLSRQLLTPPPAPAIRNQTNCTSQRFGDQVRTSCW